MENTHGTRPPLSNRYAPRDIKYRLAHDNGRTHGEGESEKKNFRVLVGNGKAWNSGHAGTQNLDP